MAVAANGQTWPQQSVFFFLQIVNMTKVNLRYLSNNTSWLSATYSFISVAYKYKVGLYIIVAMQSKYLSFAPSFRSAALRGRHTRKHMSFTHKLRHGVCISEQEKLISICSRTPPFRGLFFVCIIRKCVTCTIGPQLRLAFALLAQFKLLRNAATSGTVSFLRLCCDPRNMPRKI
jgi:hypothetical protein